MTTHTTTAAALAIGLSALLLGGCEISRPEHKQDTTTAPGTAPATMTGDSAAMSGVPATPDTGARIAATDTGRMRLEPASPQRGGVVFALVEGIATDAPRCSWKGAPLPCYPHAGGVLALIPLPADEPAGTFSFTVDHPGGRVARQITVAERPFARELIFLDQRLFDLVSKRGDVARDARATRAVLATESPVRRWRGAWREPAAGATLARAAGYGVERFYFRASDSSRAVSLDPGLTTKATFGGDTASTAEPNAVPSWRHAGLDLPLRKGSSVTAPAAASVADVGDYVLTGRTVLLDHGQGVMTAYFHLDTVLVRRGDDVARGKTVGRVGQTGLATGAHLHYGVYLHGRDVDPNAWRAMPAWVSDSTSR